MTSHAIRTSFTPALGWLTSAQAGLAAATLLWAGNFVMGRALRADIEPVSLNFLRWLVAALVLGPFVWRSLRRQWPTLRQHIGYIALLGFSGLALPHACVYQALQTTPAVNALLILNMVPLVVALGAWRMFGQPLQPTQWLGIAVSLAGALALLVRGDIDALLAVRFAAGDLWVVPAVLGSALHFLLLKKTPAGVTQGPLLFVSMIAAVAMMAPLLPFVDTRTFQALPRTWPAVLYMGVLASAVAFFLWSRGVAIVGPQRAAPFIYLMPVYGAVLAALFVGEAVTADQAVAGALVLAGLWLARPRPPATPR